VGYTREVTETLILRTDEEDGHGGQIVLEPGTVFFIDLVGIRTFSEMSNISPATTRLQPEIFP
jgi:hypothetical protein